MGLWLKCPGCQAKMPLSSRVCAACGRSLVNLPPEQRVYVLGPPEAPTGQPSAPAPAVPQEASVPAAAPPKAAKKPKRPGKKKT
jgi:hypothetical protein